MESKKARRTRPRGLKGGQWCCFCFLDTGGLRSAKRSLAISAQGATARKNSAGVGSSSLRVAPLQAVEAPWGRPVDCVEGQRGQDLRVVLRAADPDCGLVSSVRLLLTPSASGCHGRSSLLEKKCRQASRQAGKRAREPWCGPLWPVVGLFLP